MATKYYGPQYPGRLRVDQGGKGAMPVGAGSALVAGLLFWTRFGLRIELGPRASWVGWRGGVYTANRNVVYVVPCTYIMIKPSYICPTLMYSCLT